jgi:hypothetical protein
MTEGFHTQVGTGLWFRVCVGSWFRFNTFNARTALFAGWVWGYGLGFRVWVGVGLWFKVWVGVGLWFRVQGLGCSI